MDWVPQWWEPSHDNGCGSNRHHVDACTLKSHPDFNKNHATTPWEKTEQYATIQKKSNGKFSWLGERYRADGTVRPEIPSKKEKKSKDKGNNILSNLTLYNKYIIKFL